MGTLLILSYTLFVFVFYLKLALYSKILLGRCNAENKEVWFRIISQRYLGVCTFDVRAPIEISDGLALISFGTLLDGIFKPYRLYFPQVRQCYCTKGLYHPNTGSFRDIEYNLAHVNRRCCVEYRVHYIMFAFLR